MLDLEFTIQEGKLYMLQTRVGKRTGIAAVRIAVEMVKEGVISKQEAVQRVGPDQLSQYLYPIFDTKEEAECIRRSAKDCRPGLERRRENRARRLIGRWR